MCNCVVLVLVVMVVVVCVNATWCWAHAKEFIKRPREKKKKKNPLKRTNALRFGFSVALLVVGNRSVTSGNHLEVTNTPMDVVTLHNYHV